MDQSFKMALEVNDLSRDLLYLLERCRSEPDAAKRIFAEGFEPRLQQARNVFAGCCGCDIQSSPKKPAQSATQSRESGSVKETVKTN